MHRRVRVFTTNLVFWLLTASALATDFAAPVSYPVGIAPHPVVSADFNGDGKLDLAVANSGSGNVSILLGKGDGTFEAAVNYDAAIADPLALSKGDFNNDGKPDLAVFVPGDTGTLAPGELSVLLGKGDGSFELAKTTVLTVATDFAVADFNLDSKADIVVTDYDGASASFRVLVFIGNGDGTFQAPAQGPIAQSSPWGEGYFRYLAAGDFNHDAKPDLAVQVAGGVRILRNHGDATFKTGPIAPVATDYTVQNVDAAEDVDGDGKMDLVAETMTFSHSPSSEGWSRRADNISVFLGNGDGTLKPEKIAASSTWNKANVFAPPVGDSIDSAAVADFNGDGKLDLAFWRSIYPGGVQNKRALEIHLGRGDGTFSASRLSSPYANTVHAGTTADLNGDQLADLILTDLGNNAVLIALNTSAASGADLGIVGAAASADRLGLGSDLTYTANVLNEGPKDSTGVTFADTLSNRVNFVSATTTQGSCSHSHQVVTCNLGALASAFDATVTIIVTPTALGAITNAMSVSATEDDLAPANNSATQDTTVVQSFTLTVTKDGTGTGTISSDPSGIDCGLVCSQKFASDTVVSLTATGSADSTFIGWGGACSGTDPNSCSVTLNAAQSVTATFNLTPDFIMTPTQTSLTVKWGGRVSEILTFPGQGGFSGTIALVCSVSGPSPMPTCDISPASVTTGQSATLTINAAGLIGALTPMTSGRASRIYVMWLPMVILGVILIASFDKKRQQGWALAVLMTAAIALTACSDDSSSTTLPPQLYRVTVTATSGGTIQHSVEIPVTLQ